MQGRRTFLGGVAALMGTAATAGAAGDPFVAVPKHLQVFRTPPGEWPAVASLCRAFGIGTVALALAPDLRRQLLADPEAGRRAFRPFIDAGVAVRCMIGEGAWARADPRAHHLDPAAGSTAAQARAYRSGELPPNLIALLEVNDRLFRFDALLLDVEPQVLPEWKRGERAEVIRGTLGLFEDARAACRQRGMKLSAALAPWYTRNPDPDHAGNSSFDSCLERLDDILLMAYRNSPSEVLAFAGDAFAALARRPVRSWVGLTTQANDAPGSTYHALGFDRFRRDVVELHGRVRTGAAAASVAGVAIHQYATLRELAQFRG